jgi:hypothetical protein
MNIQGDQVAPVLPSVDVLPEAVSLQILQGRFADEHGNECGQA